MSFMNSIKKMFRSPRAIVLMYHRIAKPEMDPWRLSVSPENFREHLRVLSATGKVITTDNLVDNIKNKGFYKDCFCITSDDAYQDNYINALPAIDEFGCPSTFFVTSGTIGSNEPYWWDMLTDIFLSTKKLPGKLDIIILNKTFNYILDNDGAIDDMQINIHSTWHYPLSPPTQRCEMYMEIWMHLRDQPSIVIKETINRLTQWSGVAAVNNSGNFPMSKSELLTMASNKYVHTGVHTVTHAALAAFPKSIQQTEITGCKEYLDANIGTEHLTIAFPYGNFNSDTLEIVKSAGMKGAFTTDPKPVTMNTDIYQLGRFQVINMNGEQFKKQLSEWLNN